MFGSLFTELKRRNVFRVAAIYVVVSWLLMQIGDVMFPALHLPEWTTTMLVAFLLLGLPIALILAWAYEVTPAGVVRTADVPPDQSITPATGQKINLMIIAVLAIAVLFQLARSWFSVGTDELPAMTVSDRSIAVLPFKNQSASSENAEFFAGGLHDELLTLLSRLGDLKVISRTSVERLDPGLSIPEIGALLGVATVLEGQVQRAGDRLRINVQLIDTAEEGHIWANTYDSELTAENIFEV
jgi:TolB-like protein